MILEVKKRKIVGTTVWYDVILSQKKMICMQVTLHELKQISNYYHRLKGDTFSFNSECELSQLPLQGQIFLIQTNIDDWKDIDLSQLIEEDKDILIKTKINDSEAIHLVESDIEQEYLDDLYWINKCLHVKMSGKTQGAIEILKNMSINTDFFIHYQKCIAMSQMGTPEENKIYLKEAIDLLQKQHENKEECHGSCFYLFNCYLSNSEQLSQTLKRQEALSLLSQAEGLINHLFICHEERLLYMVILSMNIANIKQDCSEHMQAQPLLEECVKKLHSIKTFFPERTSRLLAQAHNNLSTCYQSLIGFTALSSQMEDNLKKSLEHALISLKLNETHFGNVMNSEIAKNIVNIATIYKDMTMTEEALTYAIKAEHIFSTLGDHSNLAVCLATLAAIYMEHSDQYLHQALKCLERSLSLMRSINKQHTIDYALTLFSLSQVQLQLAKMKADYIQTKSDYISPYIDASLESVQKSLEIFQQAHDKNFQQICLDHISQIHRESGKIDLAIDFLYDSIEIQQEIHLQQPSEELLLAYTNMVIMWEEKGDKDESEFYTNKAKQLEAQLNALSL